MSNELMRQQGQIILAKLETVYGEYSTPTGANVMLVSNPDIKPIFDKDERNNIVGHLGNQGAITVGQRIEVSFDVELAGSGTAGDKPAFDPLLQASGHAAILDVGKVDYTPIDVGFKSVSLVWRNDGVEHRVTGARGSVTFELTPGKRGMMKYKFIGKYADPTADVSPLTGIDYSPFKMPVGISFDTASFNFFGSAVKMQSLTFDPGIAVEYSNLIGVESVDITNRKGKMDTQFRVTQSEYVANIVAAKNNATGAASFTLGDQPGHTFELNVPNLQIADTPTLSWDKELAHLSISSAIVPLSRNSDYVLSFQ